MAIWIRIPSWLTSLDHLRSVGKKTAPGLDSMDWMHVYIRHIFDDIYNKNPEHQTLEISKICFCMMVFEMLWYYNRLAWVYLEIWVKDSNSSNWRGIRSRSPLFNSDCMHFTVHQFNDCCEKTPIIWHNVHLQERFKRHIFWNRMTSPFWGKSYTASTFLWEWYFNSLHSPTITYL